jgi:hypothetical protein
VGEAARSAAQILADAEAALGTASSFHIHFTGTSATDGATALDLVISKSGVQGSITSQGTTAQVIVVGGQSYLQGRDFFAKSAGPDAAAVIGDRWVKAPAGQGLGLDGFTDPKTVATCLLSSHGTLVKGATSTFQGHATIDVLDKGDVPGDSPGTVEIATSGPAYPLHFVQTGVATPGHMQEPAVCGSSSGSSSSGAMTSMQATISDFNAVVTITPPPDPFQIPSPQA